ncbi:hypothetical protein FRC0141_01687 [Corynebacterium diphtheriae]|nr:hypothetical protein FRC0140_01716 [Corynebacterium diphtheriae]CAB0756709.1 hypothetical protein FRC0141_01687 [Corynebacterium diphtheriae]CAB0756898.1 hypothetical protein FRC0118_01688 [Corynebacterium diphtheriae]
MDVHTWKKHFATIFAWIIAVPFVVRAVYVLPSQGIGSDFTPIWNAVKKFTAGARVYDEDYSTVDPHYLYSPGATALLSPIGLFSDKTFATWVMMLLGAVSILFALALATRMLTGTWSSLWLPIFVIAFFYPHEPIVSTLGLTNINGFLLLMLVVYVWGTLRVGTEPVGLVRTFFRELQQYPAWIAGVALGVCITIKPQFLTMALISLLTLHFSVLFVGAGVVIVLFAMGWVFMNQPSDYFSELLPYISTPRSYDNGSLQGVAMRYGWSSGVTTTAIVLLWLVTLIAVVALIKWKRSDAVFWAFSSIGVLFCAMLMSSGLVQGYYCIWLLPLAMTIVRKGSPMRHPVMWLAFWALFYNASWFYEHTPWARGFLDMRSVLAWLVIPVVYAIWALMRRPSAHSELLVAPSGR